MKTRSTTESELSARFLTQPETVATLALAENTLSELNDEYHYLSFDQNPKLPHHPYEGAVLFTLDARPSNRASAIAHAPSYGLENTERLDFTRNTVAHRRVILSQTALGRSLKEDHTPTFRTSMMNPDKQMVWTHPLLDEKDGKKTVAAVQLGYSINQHPNWNYPSNDDVEKIWQSHKPSLDELSRALGSLAQKTDSLTKSLEIAPPVTPNAYVIQWDIRNSTQVALSRGYSTFEAYLEAWKAERDRLTQSLGVTILDRGEGEFIIVPIDDRLDLNNMHRINDYGKRNIEPLLAQLQASHERVAHAFSPELFPKIAFGVGLGNVEADQNNNPTGQVLWDVARTTGKTEDAVNYTKNARSALFGDN